MRLIAAQFWVFMGSSPFSLCIYVGRRRLLSPRRGQGFLSLQNILGSILHSLVINRYGLQPHLPYGEHDRTHRDGTLL